MPSSISKCLLISHHFPMFDDTWFPYQCQFIATSPSRPDQLQLIGGEWIGSFHHCPDWIHTVHTLLSYRLDPEDPSDDPSDPYHPYPTSYPTYVWHIARRVGTSKSSSISGCIRWIFCTPARPLLSRLALQVAMYLPKARAKRQMPS